MQVHHSCKRTQLTPPGKLERRQRLAAVSQVASLGKWLAAFAFCAPDGIEKPNSHPTTQSSGLHCCSALMVASCNQVWR
jgi:hypothetical protein